MPPTDQSMPPIEGLYRQHGGALLLFAVSICGEYGRAQDAVHQVFLKLMETDSLKNALDPKAYLFASVRNVLLNDLKMRQRNVLIDAERLWFEPPDRDHAAERNLRRALQALPEDQRQVVVLHVWGELTFAQVAEILSISANTAASRYRYALAKLREAMLMKESSNA
ncbi:MAG: sigma-70 family RNA polymerase sigma factor [Acidobacteria bacterium]|nr:sigma-70 family RNA polymerase sigma factor [Acidobacteriota bacterium]